MSRGFPPGDDDPGDLSVQVTHGIEDPAERDRHAWSARFFADLDDLDGGSARRIPQDGVAGRRDQRCA